MNSVSPETSLEAEIETEEIVATRPTARELAAVWGRRVVPLLGLLALCLFFGSQSPQFWTIENWFNLARQQSVIMLIAFGATLVIISGQIDLSVGSVAAFCGVSMGVLLNSPAWPSGLSPWWGVLFGVCVGAVWGVLNAWLVGVARLPSFVATLGTAGIARGLTFMLCGGVTVDVSAFNLRPLAESSLLGLPLPLWILIVCASAVSFILNRTQFGRKIYAIGGNAQAARFAGIEPHRVLLGVYALAGALTGLAATIEVARNSSSAQPNAGETYPLDAIAAVVIGGSSLLGGRGNLGGTVIGALIIAVLRNGLTLLGRDPFEQMVLIGVLIVVAVALDQWRQGRTV